MKMAFRMYNLKIFNLRNLHDLKQPSRNFVLTDLIMLERPVFREQALFSLQVL